MAKLVGCAMAENVNDKGEMWSSAETVGRLSSINERTVRRAWASLEAGGWLLVVTRGGVAGGSRSTRWQMTTPDSVSGVTSDSVSGVDEATSDSVSTTADSVSTTSDSVSDEPVVTSLNQSEPSHDPRELVAIDAAEAGALVEGLRSTYGVGVDVIVADLVSRGARFTWPSQLLRAIESAIRALPNDAPSDGPAEAQRSATDDLVAQCPECDPSGFLHHDDDDLTAFPTSFPCTHPTLRETA